MDLSSYPIKSGGGWWTLSDGSKVQGESEARRAQAEIGGWPEVRSAAPQPQQPRVMVPKPKERKIAIVGFTPTRADAPYDDPSWEIWALNALYAYQDVRRVTRWFDLHPLQQIPPERVTQYAAMKIPVFLQEKDPRVPTSVAFPKQWVEHKLGSTYFTNSIAWMQGLAIAEGASAVHIFGVDMAQDTEYRHQRPCCEYWIGVAKGMGIDTYVPPTSDLVHALNQYGFESDSGLRAKLKERLTDFNQRLAQINEAVGKHQTELNKLATARATLEGAKQNCTWLMQSWTVADHTSSLRSPAQVNAPG